MHIETLKTFCDLIERGSFSKAAEANFITQSAVSQQVKTLERHFGRQLIERRQRKSIVPTEAGRQLYAECKEILGRLAAVEQRLRQEAGAMTGTIRVATVYSIGLHELPKFVKQFIRAHPQVKVHVEYSRTDKVCEACRDNAIDFGIVALPLRKPELEVIPFRQENLVLVCSPEHRLAGRRRVSLRALSGEEFIAFERDIPTRKTIDRILKEHRVEVNTVMEFDNIETIKRSVEVGVGISILPETVVGNEVRSGMLMALGFTEGQFTRPVAIVHRKGKVFSAATEEFVRMLAESAGQEGAAARD